MSTCTHYTDLFCPLLWIFFSFTRTFSLLLRYSICSRALPGSFSACRSWYNSVIDLLFSSSLFPLNRWWWCFEVITLGRRWHNIELIVLILIFICQVMEGRGLWKSVVDHLLYIRMGLARGTVTLIESVFLAKIPPCNVFSI